MDNKIQKENNNDKSWMEEYLEFYDNEEKNNIKHKNDNKNLEKSKKVGVYYKFYRYEIFLIILFIFLIYASVQYEWNFRINLSRSTWMWILSWFSSNMHFPRVLWNRYRWWFIWIIFNILDIIEHIRDIKKYILFDIFFILTLVVMSCRGWLYWTWDYLIMWLFLFTPIWYLIWYFMKRAYNKLKWYSKK